MATMLTKNVFSLARTSIQTFLPRVAANARHYSEKTIPYYDPSEGKEASREIEMPDELGGAVGIDRWELLQKAKGNEDPFMMKGLQLDKYGTKDDPTIIYSVCETRTIGCVCEPTSTTVKFTELCMGETRRCQCGHFFKLMAA